MAKQHRTQTRQQRTTQAVIWGAGIGAVCGAIIGTTFNQALPVALLLGVYMSVAEGYTDWTRQPAQLKPFWNRLISTTIVTAALGALLSRVLPLPLVLILFGLLAGLMGLGVWQLVIGLAVGVGGAVIATAIIPDMNAALAAGAVIFVYRVLLAILYPDRQVFQVSGERVPPEDATYVVPYEAHSKRIGTDYVEALAGEIAGQYARNRADIGIVESLDNLRGPTFDPALVDPLIREFYEHTSRFRLSIIPEWNRLVKPLFWLFKTMIAQEINQANIPINQEEAQLGMVSYIDSVDVAGDLPQHIKTIRGWIRAYETTGDAIYVGIYTVVKHEDMAYVSVGFPLPEANWTVTLLPHNNGGRLLLKTESALTSFSGHYLSDIDNDTKALTILKLPMMQEEIDVFIHEGALKTDHRFYFGSLLFLTLHYHIERKG